MNILISEDSRALAREASLHAARILEAALAEKGHARLLVATGASQAAFLAAFTVLPVDWSRLEVFHLDEYVGLPPEHPASFRRYLMDRLIRPTGIRRYHFLDGQAPEMSCRSIGAEIASAPIDLALAGIGENGHLAFNDPPADFEGTEPYRIVQLDEACRRQQVGEGWFASLGEVPKTAISISIAQLLKSLAIISVVPEARKAPAVKRCLEGPICPAAPASVLRRHPQASVYLDRDSARLLDTASEPVRTMLGSQKNSE